MAEVHEDDRKLFCGALPQEAKDTDIKEYFSTFGEIDSVNLKMDPVTGRSRYSEYRPPPRWRKRHVFVRTKRVCNVHLLSPEFRINLILTGKNWSGSGSSSRFTDIFFYQKQTFQICCLIILLIFMLTWTVQKSRNFIFSFFH